MALAQPCSLTGGVGGSEKLEGRSPRFHIIKTINTRNIPLICNLNNISQRLLHTWTDSLGTFFQTLIIMKISKNDSNIICRSSKDITFFKIWREWLKN